MVGKSGSGKSTLINMFTGIDHPTDGEVIVADTPIRHLDEGQMAEWRGRTMGIIFQFFQLLPTLSVVENVMIPMDLAGLLRPGRACTTAPCTCWSRWAWPTTPTSFPAPSPPASSSAPPSPAPWPTTRPSSSPTNRPAISTRAMPASSSTSSVRWPTAGKTIVMVTHDDELARQVQRTVVIADGLIVDEVRR